MNGSISWFFYHLFFILFLYVVIQPTFSTFRFKRNMGKIFIPYLKRASYCLQVYIFKYISFTKSIEALFRLLCSMEQFFLFILWVPTGLLLVVCYLCFFTSFLFAILFICLLSSFFRFLNHLTTSCILQATLRELLIFLFLDWS